jgi:hypothetical protein
VVFEGSAQGDTPITPSRERKMKIVFESTRGLTKEIREIVLMALAGLCIDYREEIELNERGVEISSTRSLIMIQEVKVEIGNQLAGREYAYCHCQMSDGSRQAHRVYYR